MQSMFRARPLRIRESIDARIAEMKLRLQAVTYFHRRIIDSTTL